MLYQNISRLKKRYSLSKHETLVQGVIEAIENEQLLVGDKLPSINEMVDEVGYARKTIVRAYEDLKDRGLVASKKMKGYYIISTDTNFRMKIALLLYAFQSFQEDFYETFRRELGKKFQIDVFFHHNNAEVFSSIISNIRGRYGFYVIAPIQNAVIIPHLKSLPEDKVLLVDRYLELNSHYSYVVQEFENSTYSKLKKLLPKMKTYEEVVLIFNGKTDYSPQGIRKAFMRFLEEHHLRGRVEENYSLHSARRNTLYFIKGDSTLWLFLRDCMELNLQPGKDVGILSYDDYVLKEITGGGISTISVDFKRMARIAARHIMHGNHTQVVLPTNLIRRNSF